jgi:hypothetical protein
MIASHHEQCGRELLYPLLMIGGVYRTSFAMGVSSYALPRISPTASRHRVRKTVRAARKTLIEQFAHARPRTIEA